MMIDYDLQCRNEEHARYLDRIRVAIRERLTSRGYSEAAIENYLAELPKEPISVLVEKTMAQDKRRGDVLRNRGVFAFSHLM
jgi:hypothetical protein